MARVGMHDAKTHLSRLVERAEAGEDVVIQRNGTPVVRLVPIVEEPRSLASVRGVWRGRVHMADDFDELPEDIAEAFGAQ
jgi:prevent-host-death family protein